MILKTFGPLRAYVVGGDDGQGGGNGPLGVLLHGFGSSASNLLPMFRAFSSPRGMRYLCPEAPLQCLEYEEGRAWWNIEPSWFERRQRAGYTWDFSREVPQGMTEASAQVEAFLDAVEAHFQVDGSTTILGGFSQGAMLACDVAFRSTRKLAGLVCLSGAILAADTWLERMPLRNGLPVFQCHGREDTVLPFSLAERLSQEMQKAGLSVTWHPFSGGHELSASVLQGLSQFLAKTLPTP